MKYPFFVDIFVTHMARYDFSTILNKAIAMPIDVLMKGWFENCLAGYGY
jgi:hypothetical protein